MMAFGRIYIGMRAKDAERLLAAIRDDAIAADGRDGAFEFSVPASDNSHGEPVMLVFNNDDMERDEMDGCVIVEIE